MSQASATTTSKHRQTLFAAYWKKPFDFRGVARQIHLHSTAGVAELLCVKNLDVLSFEYAASPENIEAVPKSMLEQGDKQIRVGIARTDVDNIGLNCGISR